MSAVLGVTLGLGLLLVWWSFWLRATGERAPKRPSRISLALADAGIERVSPAALIGTSLLLALVVTLILLAVTRSVPISICFGAFAAWVPWNLIGWRAGRRRAVLRRAWPDAVDHLRSAIRAGLSLPEALVQLASKGPEELRPPFAEFAADYRSGGKFDTSLDRLKDRLADPVADRIIEALRLTRDVGGADLGRLLGTLAEFLRDEARTRSELEARQSWTVNAARLAVAAPWLILLLMSTRHEAIEAYSTAAGVLVLAGGLVVSVICYRVMLRIGALPAEERVLA
ncbi:MULTISPECIES: type II secretion system F family protein [Arthrobacter]|uniref:Type II secretion system F family protein n=2 Tax=Arthrobacter TaxID=1663 RepID=A0ABU9KJK2_9MICC|nr:type II secretion system F family protein [Arthrobacter sp. YJM1]MDP5227258.1 type II secretion system F family protein [Arthrobacter sp. YJM1]